MTQDNTKAIVRLSLDEINNVSGGKGSFRLPMGYVYAIGLVGAGMAYVASRPYGLLIFSGIVSLRITGLIFIVGNSYESAVRSGINSGMITVAGLFGLKLQRS